MGGTSTSKQTQQSQLTGYEPAMGTVNGILNNIGTIAGQTGTAPNANQAGALNHLVANGQAGSPFTQGITSGVQGLLNGGGATKYDPQITANMDALKNGVMGQTAAGNDIGGNSALKAQLDAMTSDITGNINGQWAAAGRDLSPGNSQALGRGLAQGLAPVIAAQYNTDKSNQINAANTLYNAGNSTYGILNGNQQAANGNIATGAGLTDTALSNQNWGANTILNAESQRTGIPLSQYQTLLGMVSPIAAQFGQQNGTTTGEQTMSPIQQFLTLTQGLKNLTPSNPVSFGR